MIPQPFIKSSSERVFFGQFEYPAGADLIFDFGNPASYSNTSALSASNAATGSPAASVTASFTSFNNPGVIYPVYNSANGGTMSFRYLQSVGTNSMVWNWKSTENQTSIVLYIPSGSQQNGYGKFPQQAGASSIQFQINNNTQHLMVDMADSSNNIYYEVYGTDLNTGSVNGRNGWNMFAVTADSSSSHNYYLNDNAPVFDSTAIPRTTGALQNTSFAINANCRVMAYLQYPRILTKKEMKQVYKVFSRRFYL